MREEGLMSNSREVLRSDVSSGFLMDQIRIQESLIEAMRKQQPSNISCSMMAAVREELPGSRE